MENKMSVPENIIPKFNEELLKKPHASPDDPPRRNTKDALIDRILEVAEGNNLDLNVSNTKLKRMSKPALQKLLGEMLSETLKKQMAEAVQAPGTDDNVIALATLRMVHDMIVCGVEKGLNTYLPRYGYEVDGFSEKLKQPTVSKCVDQCLREIAAEHDILQYIESPYARLGIAWSTCLVSCIRSAPPPQRMRRQFRGAAPVPNKSYPKPINNYGTPRMGPSATPKKDPLRPGLNGREKTGQVNGNGRPVIKTV